MVLRALWQDINVTGFAMIRISVVQLAGSHLPDCVSTCTIALKVQLPCLV